MRPSQPETPTPFPSQSTVTTEPTPIDHATPTEPETDQESNKWSINTMSQDNNMGTEQKILSNNLNNTVFTRSSDPFKAERVDTVLAKVKIGDDLSNDQWTDIIQLIHEFANCFALSMSKVTAIPGAMHKLNIPEGAKFKTKVNQRPLTSPQKEFFNEVLNKMLAAGIVAPIDHKDVKCCRATTLAKTAHEGNRAQIEDLQHRLNDQCNATGIPPKFRDLPL
jgi:hypothetical protein